MVLNNHKIAMANIKFVTCNHKNLHSVIRQICEKDCNKYPSKDEGKRNPQALTARPTQNASK